jgi:hypothetical protein
VVLAWDLDQERYRVLNVARAYARPVGGDGTLGKAIAVWVIKKEYPGESVCQVLERLGIKT